MTINEYCDRCGDVIELGKDCQVKVSLEYPYESCADGDIAFNLCLCPDCAKPVIHMVEVMNDNITAYVKRR